MLIRLRQSSLNRAAEEKFPVSPICLSVMTVLMATIWASQVNASLDGYADLTAVQAKIDGLQQNSLAQQYYALWSWPVVPYINVRLGIRYFNFDLERLAALGSNREEIQPSGELLWKHPHFVFTASAFRRKATASFVTGNLTVDNLALSFNTRSQRYPRLSLRYDSLHNYDTAIGFDRDIRNQRFLGGLDYSTRDHNLAYNYVHQFTDNVITGLESRRNEHVFRWTGFLSPLASDRLRMSLNYTFSHTEQNDRLTEGNLVLESLPLASGLHAEDSEPEFGSLDPVPGLSDGNLVSPTSPPIDIGGTLAGQNIGADLGFARPVTSLYIFTNRASGLGIEWQIFISNDNLAWQPWSGNPFFEFNTLANRYEISFPPVTTRYIKAVKGGLNEMTDVLVTEIQAFQDVNVSDDLTRTANSHFADLRTTYSFSNRLDTSLDLSYQNFSGSARGIGRENLDYALRGRFRQSTAVTHNLRWGQSFQSSAAPSPDFQENGGSYLLLLQLLDTVTSNFSLSSNRSYMNNTKTQEINSGLLEFNGQPTYGVNMSCGIGRSNILQFPTGARSGVWNLRTSLDGNLTRSLDGILSYTYQHTTLKPDNFTRVRHIFGIGISWRLTRTIFVRTNLNLIDDIVNNTTQDYLVSWNLTPKWTLVGQALLNTAGPEFGSTRYIANLTYDISSRSSLYVRYSDIDFRDAGGIRTMAFQQGLRIGF